MAISGVFAASALFAFNLDHAAWWLSAVQCTTHASSPSRRLHMIALHLALFGPIGLPELLMICITAAVFLVPLFILLRILRNTNKIARNTHQRDGEK
jgi:hypothetical protein